MIRYFRLTAAFLLLLTGCDNQIRQYNTALLEMSDRHVGAAARSFSLLAKSGYAPAQFRLGILYLSGLGVPKNSRTAAYWLEKSAQQGNAGAQYFLAKLYAEGVGVPRSLTLALHWFQQLAEQGYAPAQFQVGTMYEQGLGTGRNNAEAVKWIHKAAEYDYPQALSKLAEAYRNGLLGLPKDSRQAEYWQARTEPKKF